MNKENRRYLELYDKNGYQLLEIINFDNRKSNDVAIWELKVSIEKQLNLCRLNEDLKKRGLDSIKPTKPQAKYCKVIKGCSYPTVVQETTMIHDLF